MNSDFFEEYEKYYDFSKEFEKLIKENELAGKNVNGLIRNIEVDSDGNENDEWKDEDDEENFDKNKCFVFLRLFHESILEQNLPYSLYD